MTILFFWLAQASQTAPPAQDITLAEILRQGGLVAVCGILIYICLKLLALYLKKDTQLHNAIATARATEKDMIVAARATEKDMAIAAQEREDKERLRIEAKYEEILRKRDEALRDAANKFEQLSEKFREQIRTMAVDQQKFSAELTGELSKLTDSLQEELRRFDQTLAGLKRG